jgi:hypothetical protein
MSYPAGLDPLAMCVDDPEQGSLQTGVPPLRDVISRERMRERLTMELNRGQQPTAKQKAGWHFAHKNHASKAIIMYDLVKAKWPGQLSSADKNRILRRGFGWWPEFGWWILDCRRRHPHFGRQRDDWREAQGGSPGSGKHS